MASGFRNAAGQDTDDLYDPDVIGDGPSAPGFRRADGSTLRYAAAKYGAPGVAMGMRLGSGVDIGTQWARKGTASYTDAIVIPFGYYTADSNDSHDAGATLTFTINPDGTWSIALIALHMANGVSGVPRSGNWHKAPAAGVGNAYEMQATAAFTITNNYRGDDPGPSYTPTTGWLPLSAARTLTATAGHLLGGGAGSGTVDVQGNWLIAIRKIGGTQVQTSKLACDLQAMV
jgi:hypothetical protein